MAKKSQVPKAFVFMAESGFLESLLNAGLLHCRR